MNFPHKKNHAIMIEYPSIHEWYFRSVCLNMMIFPPFDDLHFGGNPRPYLILRPWKANIWKGGRCADLPCKRWGWLDDSNWTGGFCLTLTKISSEYPQKSRVRPFVGNSRFDIRWFYINLMDAMLQLSHLFFVVCIIPWNRLKSHVLLLKVTLYCFTVGEQNAPARLIRPRFLTFVGIPGPMIWTASGMNSTLYSDVILRCFSHGCGDENNHGLTVIKPVIWLCLRISGFTQRHGWNHDGWSLWSSA